MSLSSHNRQFPHVMQSDMWKLFAYVENVKDVDVVTFLVLPTAAPGVIHIRFVTEQDMHKFKMACISTNRLKAN